MDVFDFGARSCTELRNWGSLGPWVCGLVGCFLQAPLVRQVPDWVMSVRRPWKSPRASGALSLE